MQQQLASALNGWMNEWMKERTNERTDPFGQLAISFLMLHSNMAPRFGSHEAFFFHWRNFAKKPKIKN
jgi:hypothetical protein